MWGVWITFSDNLGVWVFPNITPVKWYVATALQVITPQLIK